MDERDRLRQGGRMVGIISHVGALRERIRQGIEVLAGERGSRVLVGPTAPPSLA
jgi:exonuclease SbcC